MLSPEPRSPLNFNTATVTPSLSAHLFLLLSSSSQPSQAKSKHRRKFSSVSSSSSQPSQAKSKHRHTFSSVSSLSSVVSASLCPSLISPFIVIVLSYLLCQSLVHAAPVDTSNNATIWRRISNSSDHLSKENLNSSSYSIPQDDMPQNDEPPRSIYPSYTVPDSWKRQSQDRIYYLRAENDQFLQFNGYQVTGTKVAKPALGVVRFMSHETSMVIIGFHEEKYLCMNSTFALYLSDRIDPECYIQESSLLESGSHATAYDFIKYKTNIKLYLGINCDPMLGSETNLSMKATRFSRLDISEDEAETVRKEVEKSGPERHVQEKCERISERKFAARVKRRKLRYRWCWNIDRMTVHRMSYLQQCYEREGNNCDINYQAKDSEECVCDILWRMLTKPKRAKRKCLIEKITKWVKHQNSTPNSLAIIEASRLLLPSYSGIARRMHLLKSKQSKHQEEVDPNNKPIKKTNQKSLPSHPSSSDKETSMQTSHPHKIRHQCHEDSSHKCRHKAIKLNSILEEHRQELLISDNNPSHGEYPSLTSPNPLVTNGAGSEAGKHKEISVLSDKFKKALKLLTKTILQKQTKQRRRKKPRQARHLQNSHLKSKLISRSDEVDRQSRPDADTLSPG